MAKWKLCRQTYGNDVYEFTEGDEVTIGRGTQNTIILPSLNISRKHCAISVKKDEVVITDLQSANGIFVGLKKITPNTPVSLSENDVIGLGWTDGAPLARVNDTEKFVFKLQKVSDGPSIIDRIQFQNENIKTECIENIEAEMAVINNSQCKPSPKSVTHLKLSLKRKSSTGTQNKEENSEDLQNGNEMVITDTDNKNDSIELHTKRFKSNFVFEDIKEEPIIKIENEAQYEAFNIKQECSDDDEIQVVDSDSESENWFVRLSQNSPGKSFTNFSDSRKSNDCPQDSSYSQLDDDVIFVGHTQKKNDESEDEYIDDLITILPQQPLPVDSHKDVDICKEKCNAENNTNNQLPSACNDLTNDDNTDLPDLITILPPPTVSLDDIYNKNKETLTSNENHVRSESVPSCVSKKNHKETKEIKLREDNIKEPDKTSFSQIQNKNDISKKIQIVENIPHFSKKPVYIQKSKSKKKYEGKKTKSSSSKIQITNSQKEYRKKKLREIATKEKVDDEQICNSSLSKNEDVNTTAMKVNAKVTTSNRGAFLIETDPAKSKPSKRKKSLHDNNTTSSIELTKECNNKKDRQNSTKSTLNNDSKEQTEHCEKIEKEKGHYKETQSSKKVKNSQYKNKITPTNNVKGVSNIESVDCSNQSLSSSIKSTKGSKADSKSEKQNIHVLQPENTIHNSPKVLVSNIPKHQENLVCQNNTTSKHVLPPETNMDVCYDKISATLQNSSKDKGTIFPRQQENSVISKNIQIPIMHNKQKSSTKTILKPMKENKVPEIKNTKRVRFSEVQPEIIEFEIEQGNQMKKTSTAKLALLATRHDIPVFSLEKIALMRILRWNPQWIEEQKKVSEPPPILGHNNIPMAIMHSFSSHTQYVDLIGDLLLMEIWECLTQGYLRNNNGPNYHQMRIETLPLVAPERRALELVNLSVNVSLPTAQAKLIPREGEIMMIRFGEEFKICRFFFVHNVKCLPSPPNNLNSFYSISLQTSYTEKIKMLQRGTVMYGISLAYINKDLRLFEAMEYLSRSPLNEVILNPQPQHFVMGESGYTVNMESQWTKPLNDSQKRAVKDAVTAALEDIPRIKMVQGPPGTGKSRVICAIVMAYFYDMAVKKQKNRGKILICATSNAAVDELVLRLLDIRQSLPQPDRLNMVRVGRVEAMHPRARDISSVKLAQRDAARLQADPAHAAHAALAAPAAPAAPAVFAEISLLEAKKNMWQSKAMASTDDAYKAYCQNRVAEIGKKIAMYRSGAAGPGAACAPELLAQAERRVLERADVVLTTLASAHSHKMRGLAGRIALCIVDEAGQAIEPETLVPLTLDVTRLVLIGDPQQLPGFICSQRAKQHGLGESLFARLSSCAEAWGTGAVTLLDRQYRMHAHIAEYPNRAFYGGQVLSSPGPRLPLTVAPYFVLGIISGDKGQDASGANAVEAWGVARVTRALRAAARGASLAVITPYAAQRDLVRRHLRMLAEAEGDEAAEGGAGAEGEVEVNTVDSFQGQERDVVVVSLARSHGLGFLADAGRMNVMLTRARHALVLCLNPYAVEKHNQWRSLVEDAQKRKLYGTLPSNLCQHPSIQKVSNQEILQYLSSKPPPDNAKHATGAGGGGSGGRARRDATWRHARARTHGRRRQ